MTNVTSTVWINANADKGNHATEGAAGSGKGCIEGRNKTEKAQQRNDSRTLSIRN